MGNSYSYIVDHYIMQFDEIFLDAIYCHFTFWGFQFFVSSQSLTLIPTKLCPMIYCCGDKSYPCLVGIGLNTSSKKERENIGTLVLISTCHHHDSLIVK